ncbi:MAG: phenylacetate--CoA ligase family protein [Thermoplasmata archaeon]|nr:phenylacetate--CoA ligase family protein [Thermoplasmata archaeon]
MKGHDGGPGTYGAAGPGRKPDIYNLLSEHLIYPFFDAVRGTRNIKRFNFLRKSQYWPREDLERYTDRLLRDIIRHAYDTVPYYHRIFKERGLKPEDMRTAGDLKKLPVLRKEDIKANWKDMVSTTHGGQGIEYRTGGSTGTPLRFLVTKDMLSWGSAAVYRIMEWAGIMLGDRGVLIWGSNFDINEKKSLYQRIRGRIKRYTILDAFILNEERLRTYASVLHDIRPRFIRGYASPLYMVARYIEENGLPAPHPLAVISTSEKLYDFQREKIEEVFQCPVFDHYGGRETSLSASECREHHGYHLSVENTIVEIARGDEVVGPGELGEMLLTDLHNRAMPFIRYAVGDLAAMGPDEKGPCGISLPFLSRLEGRLHHFIVTRDGTYIPGEFFPHMMKDLEGVREYQVYQRNRGEVEIRLVLAGDAGSTDSMEETIRERIAMYAPDLEVRFRYMDSIPVPESGKRLFTLSEAAGDMSGSPETNSGGVGES